MNPEPIKPAKKDYVAAAWITLAGMLLGIVINFFSPKGFEIMKVLGW